MSLSCACAALLGLGWGHGSHLVVRGIRTPEAPVQPALGILAADPGLGLMWV